MEREMAKDRPVPKRCRILNIDGGGIYGYTAALWLRELCERDPEFLEDFLDLLGRAFGDKKLGELPTRSLSAASTGMGWATSRPSSRPPPRWTPCGV